MEQKYNTIKISKLVKVLNAFKKEYGDLGVMVSSDTEGNSWGTIEPNGKMVFEVLEPHGFMVLYPHEEHIDTMEFYMEFEDATRGGDLE
jgi:hypothetical protein